MALSKVVPDGIELPDRPCRRSQATSATCHPLHAIVFFLAVPLAATMASGIPLDVGNLLVSILVARVDHGTRDRRPFYYQGLMASMVLYGQSRKQSRSFGWSSEPVLV